MTYDIQKEKREAIDAGRKAISSLETARDNLNSAKNWGLVDMEQAKYDLRNFSRELRDVNMACDLNFDIGDFLTFADYFFDGFFVDWMVQDRISTAKRQVEEAIRRIEDIVDQLQQM